MLFAWVVNVATVNVIDEATATTMGFIYFSFFMVRLVFDGKTDRLEKQGQTYGTGYELYAI